MFTFRIAEHRYKTDEQVVEIWKEGKLIGVIYSTERGIKIVSKYIAAHPEAAIEIERDKLSLIPAILVNLIREEQKNAQNDLSG